MVEGRKTLREQAPEIEKILSSAQLIVFYGKDVPASPKKSGITLPQAKTLDLAHEFSEAHGASDPATDSWKACTLEECVTYFGGKAPETTAASEAEAAAFTFRELLRDPWYGKPLKSIEVATGKTFWDYGDEEGRLAGKDAASHASKEKKAEEDSEESETDRELREAERFWLKPTPAKFVILALGAIGFTVAGEPGRRRGLRLPDRLPAHAKEAPPAYFSATLIRSSPGFTTGCEPSFTDSSTS